MTPARLRARIRRICRQEGASQSALAQACGIARQSLGLYLSRGEASDAILAKLGIERRVDDRIAPDGGVAQYERALPKPTPPKRPA